MNKFIILSIGISCTILSITLDAKTTYTKKAPYAGMGKKSNRNELIKTKGISGHGKRTKKGYTYVNPYARSK